MTRPLLYVIPSPNVDTLNRCRWCGERVLAMEDVADDDAIASYGAWWAHITDLTPVCEIDFDDAIDQLVAEAKP